MKMPVMPTVYGGVLLSRNSEVHRLHPSGWTGCGKPAPAGRVAPCSHVQALVFKLPLCTTCFPNPHSGYGRR